ncbi:hypothetical protein FRB99_001889 [Tulasnella sp. 403]|nr:hypothetical protein FRB99_001889 [Tulasnella sp. 403]
MVGHPKHVPRALAVGVDLICAQGGEGGGHTGDIPTALLIPACVDAVKGKKSPLTGGPVHVIAAGGIFDGRGLAAALMFGAVGAWVGTRFVASVEASAPKAHKQAVTTAGLDDDIRTLIYTGRPLRVRKTPYILDWEENRQDEIKELLSQGVLPIDKDMEKHPEKSMEARPWLMGKVSGLINEVLPAKKIIDDMVSDAAQRIRAGNAAIAVGFKAKL